MTAYNNNGTAVATTTTDSSGNYTLTGLTDGQKYRIEFTGVPSYLRPGAVGTSSATTVAFATSPSTSVGLALQNPGDYTGNSANPEIVTSISFAGDTQAGNYSAAGTASIVGINYNASGTNTALAPIEDVGSTWGIAYQRSTNTIFVAASLKRNAGFGSQGPGGIYIIDRGNPGSASPWVNLDTDLGISTGTVNRTGAANQLPALAGTSSWDQDAYKKVGKMSIGDIDFDEVDRTLWLTNLNNRSLYGIQNVDPGQTPTAGDVLGPFSVDSSGITCTNGVLRPWGVKVHDGKVYVGTICTGENSGASRANLIGHVLVFDPANSGAGFSNVLTINFNDPQYNHPMTPSETQRTGHTDGDGWQTWYSVDQFMTRDQMANFADGSTYKARYAVPILSDIEFDANGNMIVGVKSRFGAMQGQHEYTPNYNNTDLIAEVVGAGDILRACLVSGAYVLEGTSSSCTASTANGEGPGGTEYFYADNALIWHEQTTGALALLPRSNEVVTTVYDTNAYYQNGLEWYSTADGSQARSYVAYTRAETSASVLGLPLFGKGNGLGDLELLVPPPPIEIGNRVWDDYDGDGVQDAGEPGIAGVVVGLYDDNGALVATVTTDSDGTFLFSSDTSKSDTTGRNYGVTIDSAGDYTLGVLDSNFQGGGALATYSNTLNPNVQNLGNNAVTDNHDSDGNDLTTPVGSGGNISSFGVSFTNQGSGADNHSFDFGFSQFDLGDAPDSYGTTTGQNGPRHLISRDSNGNSTLYIGSIPTSERDGQPGSGADNDTEGGVTFSSPQGSNSIYADVPIVNNTGGTVTVCAWLDIPSGGTVDGQFDASDGMCQTTSATTTTLTFQWSGLPNDKLYSTYARFRITSDSITTSSATSSVTASNGEVEDYPVQFDFEPTLATIGQVTLNTSSVGAFLTGLDTTDMTDATLHELLQKWDPQTAAALEDAGRQTLLSALSTYLDPDGDGQVAVFRWDTLEERGTIGFYVERRQGSGDWVRINGDLLPGLINAPMGAEYQLADPTAGAGQGYEYRLIELEANGGTRTYGPFSVEMPQ